MILLYKTAHPHSPQLAEWWLMKSEPAQPSSPSGMSPGQVPLEPGTSLESCNSTHVQGMLLEGTEVWAGQRQGAIVYLLQLAEPCCCCHDNIASWNGKGPSLI